MSINLSTLAIIFFLIGGTVSLSKHIQKKFFQALLWILFACGYFTLIIIFLSYGEWINVLLLIVGLALNVYGFIKTIRGKKI